MKYKFIVTLDCDPSYFSKTYLRGYVREAVKYWCKSYQPGTPDFHIGNNVTVKHGKEDE